MTAIITPIVLFFAVLFPQKAWFTPAQPWDVKIKSTQQMSLRMIDFAGKPLEAKGKTEVQDGQVVNVKALFPDVAQLGTYVLLAVPAGKEAAEFVGTPVVIEVRANKRRGAPPEPMVVHMVPLQYAVMKTDQGSMKMIFFYDVAPNTVENFLNLSLAKFYDGLTFHRIVKGFVIQGGDPTGNGSGGPGYNIVAEFSDRPHQAGVLSMARNGDPAESAAAMPRAEFANSAGSQFFICLDYANTKQLDNRYTAFGTVVDGMDVVKKIASVPLGAGEKPQNPLVIESVEVLAVTAADNPYAALLKLSGPEK